MKNKHNFLNGKYFVLALLAAATISGIAATRSNKGEITRNLDIFNALYKELQTNYVDSISAEKSINTAISAMLNDIDPYTEYYSSSNQDDIALMTSGEYAGIGAIIMEKPGKGVFISEPYLGSPSQKAGLKAGDLIMMVDNDTVTSWHSDQVKNKLTGQAGTPLKVQVKRPYATDSIITVNIVREKIQIPTIPYYGVVKDNIGYIDLSSFTDKSGAEVRNALIELKKNPKVKSIILDLRGNTGGLLEEAVKIVGLFVPKNTEVLRTRGKGVMNEKIYKTTTSPVDTEIPLVILTDGNTASASEITAGALQDLDRAVIVGSRSFGKGLVQTTRPLPYDGILKVTIAKYYIPSGRLIQAIDYSHRNPDGSVARIPDSLTNVFKTLHGREVRDGGGITPDIKVEYPEINRLTYNIIVDHWAFDYATKFAAQNPTIAPADQFVLTDSIFDDFKAYIDPKKFNYDKVCEQMLAALQKTAEAEGYMNDSIKAQFKALEGMLKHNLDHDLDNNRRAIEEILAGEIIKRYYYQQGQVIEALKRDETLDSAAVILNDINRYKALLSAPGTKLAKK
ncbi:S41 family peptidase [uncultured Muribaculum sp.]|uniref:S41 family peptidase n=1 Tax=uncultured Muribaculum sp. TaxID=1918613 RepID=UPI0025918A74|nr:S41 family peptidase [uncultured Muribaculum sp.]